MEVRTLTVALGLAMLPIPRDASAISIPPGDIAGPVAVIQEHDDFISAHSPPPTDIGEVLSVVGVLPSGEYLYLHRVLPYLGGSTAFSTQFKVQGFTGTAGWLFHEALDAGGSGTASDFAITYHSPGEPLGPGDILGQLEWAAQPSMDWIAREPVSFFYVSSLPPGPEGGLRTNYQLVSGNEFGTAQLPAPIPEPGSIALLGSGLLGLYAHMRRRGQEK